MDLLSDFRKAAEASELDAFRLELVTTVHARAPKGCASEELDFAFVCEFSERLSNAEEFQDFIPCHGSGVGLRTKNFRVDGYEIDETDDSIRLLIASYSGTPETQTITRTLTDTLFGQLKAFVEASSLGRTMTQETSTQAKELAATIRHRHGGSAELGKSISRYRFYLITDANLSDRVKDLPSGEIDGIPIDHHIWDISRLKTVSSSMLGAEEFEIDFTEFVDGGLPCLRASEAEGYEGFLCVIQGDALSDIYDRYGSKLLEGNVRSFLSTTGKINKGIQATIRADPEKFFVFNNGISATATSANVSDTPAGPRLLSAKYLQIVNGGQTTASLHAAKRKDRADLGAVHVPMKLTVVHADDTETLDDLIQKIAKYSNSQNKVSDADFFSNHPFHRAIERYSRTTPAPRPAGVTTDTFWFYERARGQYVNAQAKMTIKQKKDFLRDHPRAQLISKTDLAKYENAWRMQPHLVSRGAQKNFLQFAEHIGRTYGTDGAQFNNAVYFKGVVAKAILFRFAEGLVSNARATWYSGENRAQIVAYAVAKLVATIDEQAMDLTLDLNLIWLRQGVSSALAQQMEVIAKAVSAGIHTPPTAGMRLSDWHKNESCWESVKKIKIDLSTELHGELVSRQAMSDLHEDATERALSDIAINAVVAVINVRAQGGWQKMNDWALRYNPLFGKELDLVRLASRKDWFPSDKQATLLMKVLSRLEQEGFRMGSTD